MYGQTAIASYLCRDSTLRTAVAITSGYGSYRYKLYISGSYTRSEVLVLCSSQLPELREKNPRVGHRQSPDLPPAGNVAEAKMYRARV
jgi:hypothetical protein